ncbi:hypothetical protein ACFX13_020052 [Malus domestica]
MRCSTNLKNVRALKQIRYMVLKQMMMHAIDNLQTASIVSSQTTRKLKRDIEKLKEEKELNKKKISDMYAEIQQLRLKNAETSGKVNLLLNEIGILKNKLQENQTKVPEVPIDDQMESREEISKDQIEDVQIEAETEDVEIAKQPEAITGKDQVQVPIDVQMDNQYVEVANLENTSANMATPEGKNTKDGQEENAEEKKMTRTLHEENLEPIIEREKEKRILEVIKARPIAKETKRKPAKKTNPKSSKSDKGSYLPSTTHAYKLLDNETIEKIKEYYRQDEMDYFCMQPKKQNMAHELVVLKSDLTTLFIDGAIDSNIIDASFFIMSENETKIGQEQNLYLPSFIFNDM